MPLTRDQERAVCDALVAIMPAENYISLRADSLPGIQRILGCSDDQAMDILDDLYRRELIAVELTPLGGEIGGRTMPTARSRWTQAGAHI